MTDIDGLIGALRIRARQTSKAQQMLAEAKSLRQEGNAERRTDLYMWPEPEQTVEWQAADALAARDAMIHQLGENAAKAAGEYAERVDRYLCALQTIANEDWTWATVNEMRQCARAALTEPTDG